MCSRGQLIFGSLVLLLGIVLLIGNVFEINVWAFCWPILIIAIGVWLIIRPQLGGSHGEVNLRPLGTIRRHGEWHVRDEEIWMLVGDVDLDLSRATID